MFFFEGFAAVAVPCPAVPVVGVPLDAFFAVEIGVDGHGGWGFQVVDAGVGLGPVPFCIPPECKQLRRKTLGRCWGRERGGKLMVGHALHCTAGVDQR